MAWRYGVEMEAEKTRLDTIESRLRCLQNGFEHFPT